MRNRNILLAILSIMCVVILAGCGGGSEVAGAGVPEWKVTLVKALVTRAGPDQGNPVSVDLPLVDGKYQANAGDTIVPVISPNSITRGGPNQVYIIVNLETGQKDYINETPEAEPYQWQPSSGNYRIDAVVNGKDPAVPAFLVVR